VSDENTALGKTSIHKQYMIVLHNTTTITPQANNTK